MINEQDIKLIVDVFKKAQLNEEEKKYLEKLEVIQSKVELHEEFMSRFKDIDEKLKKLS